MPQLRPSTAEATDPPFDDREQRRAVNLSGFGLLEDGRTFAVSIAELSYKGCKIETSVALLPGLRLTLSVTGSTRPVHAIARWYKDGFAGLEFTLEDASAEQTLRQHERLQLSAEIVLRRMGRQQYQARLLDLTPAGCKVEFVERPRAEEILWIRFHRFDAIEAKVRWVDGFYGGLEFARPIYPAVFDLLLAGMR
jgi:PilZ domain